ncbi:MAG: hypothetical protein JW958_02670 [Candidatus Eisenbacteria bacterium]|nr:hypothetical protein [Candidatus Eisenbacteria bacterium]
MTRKRNGKDAKSGRRAARAAGAAVLLAAVLLAGGCFFSPRDAEEASTGESAVEPAKTKEEVLTLLQVSYEKFYEAQYQVLLSVDFAFHPDRTDSSELADAGVTGYLAPWGNYEEIDTFNRLLSCFNSGSERIGYMILEYTGDPVTTDSSVSGYSTYESDYRVGIYYFDIAAAADDSLVFDGSLRLYIHDEGDAFRIYRWDDFRKGNLSTWGYYKGQVAGGQDYCP